GDVSRLRVAALDRWTWSGRREAARPLPTAAGELRGARPEGRHRSSTHRAVERTPSGPRSTYDARVQRARQREGTMRKAAFGVAIGLGVLALSFAVLGLVLNNQASFSKHYVHDQLAEKQITFTPVENLLPNQKTVPCLVENAGEQRVSGKQAEC